MWLDRRQPFPGNRRFCMAYETYQMVTGTVLSVEDRENDCCTKLVRIRDKRQEIHLVVSGHTVVIQNIMLRPGMRIAAFYDGNLPVPTIYPPVYQAELVTMLWRNQSVKLGYFDAELLAGDRSLQLNLDRQVKITTVNGQRYECSPGNAELLVYYTYTTMSLPPMTTPQKIIVMCQK